MSENDSKFALLEAEYHRVRAENERVLNRQYLGEAADRVLAQLRDAYAADSISLETLERVTEDIVRGRPTRLPFQLLRLRSGSPDFNRVKSLKR